jgi:hypothetical protein
VVGARLLKAPGTKTCGMVGSMRAGRSIREKERERRGGPLPATSSSSDGGRNKAATLSAWGARAQRQASE